MSKVKRKIVTIIKITVLVTVFLVVLFMVSEVPEATNIDFSVIREKLSSGKATKTTKAPKGVGMEMPIAPDFNPEQEQKRAEHLKNQKTKLFVDKATKDYYLGNYNDALRRLERAKKHDPGNYTIFKLSGQIFFEKSELRKAFNNWERATQLPHNDSTISRNLDVVRRLIRYSRNEIDRLQRSVYKDPNNLIARARLRELEKQMSD